MLLSPCLLHNTRPPSAYNPLTHCNPGASQHAHNTQQQNLENRVIHDIMTVLMRADRNQDFTIGPNELNIIIFSLNNIDGIDFNEKLFRELLETHGEKYGDEEGQYRIDGAMRVIRNLLDDDVPEEYNVFNIRTDQLKEKLHSNK